MAKFQEFQKAVGRNEFWELPIDRLNANLKRNHKKDRKVLPGVTLIIGCPFQPQFLTRFQELKDRFEAEITAGDSDLQVLWRNDPEAYHFTVYSLKTPEDFSPDQWPLTPELTGRIRSVLDGFRSVELTVGGIGILGMGAVSLGIFDSSDLKKLRLQIAHIPGVSREKFGSSQKIVVGRVKPSLLERDREVLKNVSEKLKDFKIGSFSLSSPKIVFYHRTSLEGERVEITV